MNASPLVSVLTPVYNGEAFLAECIESVLAQTYSNFEYTIVNNCSTDRSLQIARQYEGKDRRIRVQNNEKFVGVIENHNIAFRLVPASAKYVKIVSADDFLFRRCIGELVELAEASPSVGVVGSYQLSGDRIRWQGFRYPKAVWSGREICRRFFLEGNPDFGFGTPTSILYRAELVRSTPCFYPNASPHADTSACFEQLRSSDFGFVYQVLSFERVHGETQSSASADINRYSSANLNDLINYGPAYLSDQELAPLVRAVLADYHRFLAINRYFGARSKEFWAYHQGRLAELGYPLGGFDLPKAVVGKALEELTNPGQALRKLRVWLSARQGGTAAR
jgi:glycosyltransferase involved in cell wall biosynthesis